MRKFADREQQNAYRFCMRCYEARAYPLFVEGERVFGSGGGYVRAFWKGYDVSDTFSDDGTVVYACYMAGFDIARRERAADVTIRDSN